MENFADAADSRLEDWENLNKEHRKVGTIHFGGIYIECLLKGMICCIHSVSDGPQFGRWIVDGNEVSRPGHSLTSSVYRGLLQDLYDDMSEDIMNSLEYVSQPNDISYIDYRYIQEDGISEADYETWSTHFIRLFDYLQDKKHEL